MLFQLATGSAIQCLRGDGSGGECTEGGGGGCMRFPHSTERVQQQAVNTHRRTAAGQSPCLLAAEAQKPVGERRYMVLPANKSDCIDVCGAGRSLQNVWHTCQRRRHSSAHAAAPGGLPEPQWGRDRVLSWGPCSPHCQREVQDCICAALWGHCYALDATRHQFEAQGQVKAADSKAKFTDLHAINAVAST